MGQRRHHHQPKRKARNTTNAGPVRASLPVYERKQPVVYGKPFVVLEDVQRQTFVYNGGQWVPHTKTIAECRTDCQVKELAQKINGMTRYEVCAPITSAT
jgi:hypothetical protein